MMPCFGLVTKPKLVTPVFWLLLSSAGTASELSRFPSLPPMEKTEGGEEVESAHKQDAWLKLTKKLFQYVCNV